MKYQCEACNLAYSDIGSAAACELGHSLKHCDNGNHDWEYILADDNELQRHCCVCHDEEWCYFTQAELANLWQRKAETKEDGK